VEETGSESTSGEASDNGTDSSVNADGDKAVSEATSEGVESKKDESPNSDGFKKWENGLDNSVAASKEDRRRQGCD